jgi:hypothetical protein
MAEFSCEICKAPMKLSEKLPPVKKMGKTYRVRRFKCTVCDFEETIFGDGSGDMNTGPQQGIKDVKEMYDQEEENRNI